MGINWDFIVPPTCVTQYQNLMIFGHYTKVDKGIESELLNSDVILKMWK
uniref:Uncharacterized protein n=1 Tax=Wuchereria bancrofti TaxID=6293 RepID=A0AAF5PHU9_WUCBA